MEEGTEEDEVKCDSTCSWSWSTDQPVSPQTGQASTGEEGVKVSGCAELKWVCKSVGLVKVAEHRGQLLTDWSGGERWSRWILNVVNVMFQNTIVTSLVIIVCQVMRPYPTLNDFQPFQMHDVGVEEMLCRTMK